LPKQPVWEKIVLARHRACIKSQLKVAAAVRCGKLKIIKAGN
jgi:hypothetical protein